MRTISIAMATAVLLAGAAFAADPPGQQMKDEPGSPGASEYAPPSGANETTPGQQMQEDTGPGASQYAPGEPIHQGAGKRRGSYDAVNAVKAPKPSGAALCQRWVTRERPVIDSGAHDGRGETIAANIAELPELLER